MLPTIWVPSRGRAGHSPTIKRMVKEGLVPNVVVPADEAEAYAEADPTVRVHPLLVQGIGLTRAWILEKNRRDGEQRFWMIDDDISNIAHRPDFAARRYYQSTWTTSLSDMTGRVPLEGNVALAGPVPRQYGYTKMVTEERDRRVGFCVLVRTDGPWNYWPFLHEDTDITLQVLTNGWSTRLFYDWGFNTGVMSTTEGGCQPDYLRGAGTSHGIALHDKWERTHPGLVSLVRNRLGSTVTRVDWKRFRT